MEVKATMEMEIKAIIATMKINMETIKAMMAVLIMVMTMVGVGAMTTTTMMMIIIPNKLRVKMMMIPQFQLMLLIMDYPVLLMSPIIHHHCLCHPVFQSLMVL